MTKLIFPGENAGISEVLVTDSPAPRNNMCHEYLVRHVDPEGGLLCAVSFLRGPVNDPDLYRPGVTNEDLLKIVLHRLQGAQDGEFACRENQKALEGVEQALLYLNMRTADRQQRGVEGKNVQ